MKQVILCAGLALVLVTVGCGGGGGETESTPAPETTAAPAPAAAPAADAGGIQGGVVYAAEDSDTVIKMDADPQCASLHSEDVYTDSVVADADGNLANVFVYVKEGASGGHAAPSTVAVLDQVGCMYQPHVSGVMTGQPITIRNSDQTLHNVHALPTVNAEFNQGQPFAGMELEHSFDKPEVMVRFKCDVHPWMSSYMGVLDHPYFAVTGADGSFSIADLAPGDYVLEAWHEELGTRTESVTVGASETVEVSFDFAS